MRKFAFVVVLLCAVAATTDCASWWKQFESNPVAQVQAFEQGAQVVLNDVQIAWVIIQPLIPASALPAVTQQYEKALFDVNHALQALNDAVTAAEAAQQPNPNFTAFMTAVTNAIAEVLAIIDQYQANIGPDGGTIPPAISLPQQPAPTFAQSLSAAHTGLTQLKRVSGK
jgi:hypothetical protein